MAFLLADTTVSPDAASAAAAAFLLIFSLIMLVVALFYVVTMWVIFSKGGQPGWAAIIPIFNTIVLLNLVGRPVWWFLLLLIPFVNIVVGIILLNDLSKSFGHGVGFTLGLLFLSLIFLPILAFGGSKYVGPAAKAGAYPVGYQVG